MSRLMSVLGQCPIQILSSLSQFLYIAGSDLLGVFLLPSVLGIKFTATNFKDLQGWSIVIKGNGYEARQALRANKDAKI